MRVFNAIRTSIILAFVMPLILLAQDSLNIHWVGGWTFGRTENISVGIINGHRYAMLTSGGGILILNVDNPTNPIRVSQVITKVDRPNTFFTNNLLFVAERGEGLKIFNLQNPSLPILVGRLPALFSVNEIFVKGNYAYITDWYKLRIVDITNPETPLEVGSCNIREPPAWAATGIAVKGSYAYCVTPAGDDWWAAGDIIVINVLNPATPYVCYDTVNVDVFYGVEVFGDYLFAYHGGVKIFDLSMTPWQPVYCATLWEVFHGEVYGQYFYATAWDTIIDSCGVAIYDISDISSPVRTGWVTLPRMEGADASEIELAYLNGYVYVTAGLDGMRVVDVNDPYNPYETGYYAVPGYLREVFVKENYAYLCSEKMLSIVDISTPTNCNEIGRLVIEDGARFMGLADNYVYITDGAGKLNVIDVSVPTNPIKIGDCFIPHYWAVQDLWAKDSFVYVADHLPGLSIVNVANPQQPFIVSTYDSVSCSFEITGAESYIYVAGMSNVGEGLDIINVQDPLHPFRASFLTAGQGNLSLSKNYIYITGWSSLYIIDVSNPTNPVLINTYPFRYYNIYVSSTLAYCVAVSSPYYPPRKILTVLDVSNPYTINELGYYYGRRDGFYYAVDAFYANGYIYVSQWHMGLHIYKYYGTGIEEENKKVIPKRLQVTNLKDLIKFSYYLENPSKVEISLIDVLGRIVVKREENRLAGNYTDAISKKGVACGVYFILVETKDWVCAEKVVIIK